MKRIAPLLLLLCGVAAAENAPSWLGPLSSVALPQYDKKVNTVVLLTEERTVVGEQGKLTTTTRTAIRFLTRVGSSASFYDEYDARSGKIKDFNAWMIAPSGKVKKYGKNEIIDVACAENDVYNECRRRLVSSGSDADAGATFGYESVVERESFSNQVVFHFQDSSPALKARFVLTAPAGWDVQAVSFNGAPAQPVISDGSYTWEMNNLPRIEPEPNAPSFLSLAPWVGVNLSFPGATGAVRSWPEAARLMFSLNEGVSEPNDAVAAKAQALVEGAATELDKIRAIARFVQQVNYVSIQINLATGGGYRPHAAAEVFQKLYGDCKDKANLMRAMLGEVGITAYPVAIYSGDRTHVQEKWPSLGVFNHAISAIRVGPETDTPAVLAHPTLGRLLFFDPTDPSTPAGYLPDYEQASLALVGSGSGGDLVRVPVARAVAAARTRTVEATLGADGSLKGSFEDRRTGEALPGAVASYRSSASKDYIAGIERWVARGIPGGAATGIEVADSEQAFVTRGQFASQRYAQMPQQRMMIFRAAPLARSDVKFTEKTRKYPVELDADALEETVKIVLPAGFQVDELPEPVHVESPYGAYDAAWEVEQGSVLFHQKIEIQPRSVPADQYAELNKFLKVVDGAGDSPVVLLR